MSKYLPNCYGFYNREDLHTCVTTWGIAEKENHKILNKTFYFKHKKTSFHLEEGLEISKVYIAYKNSIVKNMDVLLLFYKEINFKMSIKHRPIKCQKADDKIMSEKFRKTFNINCMYYVEKSQTRGQTLQIQMRQLIMSHLIWICSVSQIQLSLCLALYGLTTPLLGKPKVAVHQCIVHTLSTITDKLTTALLESAEKLFHHRRMCQKRSLTSKARIFSFSGSRDSLPYFSENPNKNKVPLPNFIFIFPSDCIILSKMK